MEVAQAVAQSSGFNLKHESVELMGRERMGGSALVALADLETMRAHRSALPASKHGLETICGASCDTGAQ